MTITKLGGTKAPQATPNTSGETSTPTTSKPAPADPTQAAYRSGFQPSVAPKVSLPSADSQALSAGPSAVSGAPLLPSSDASQVLPAAIRDMAPMDRHLWFFKAASVAAASHTSIADAQVDTSDHQLNFHDMDTGMKALGLNGPEAALLSLGVLVDRGGRQLLKGQGSLGQMDISPGAAWATGHPDTARSGVYDANGNVDPQKEQQFLDLLDPQGTDRITMDQFKAAGKTIAAENDPGSGPVTDFKRWMDEGTFDRAWNSFMTIAGHQDASGQSYVTRDDVKWFFDGTYFFRRAEALQGA